MVDMTKIVEYSRAMEAMGCCVVVITPEELQGANPRKVEERLIELGWEVISDLAPMPIDEEEEESAFHQCRQVEL